MGKYSRKKRSWNLPPSGNWLLTYSDMMTLLLTFFVLLFTFSSMDVTKFQAVLYSLQDALGLLEAGTTLNIAQEQTSVSGELEGEWLAEQRRLEELMAELETFIEDEGLGEQVLVSLEERGLVIRFLDTVLFDLGSAELKEESMKILEKVAEVLQGLPNQIRAEGHTDNLPISTYRYPSNWELSSTRAASVIRFLLESYSFSPNQLAAIGYGEYRPIAPNKPGGQPLNRRVDLVVLREAWNSGEPEEWKPGEEAGWE
ncbi:MAG TPA: OmpA family protein [Firmicutes bacterium]|jgi:chemotaxis protein MotB|nr:OmpA family protein [Bacillota bacterium]